MVHMYNGILLSHVMNEIRPFAATWKDLDTFILSVINQTMINIIRYYLSVESKN